MRSIEYHHLLLLVLSVIHFYTTDAELMCPLCNSVSDVPVRLNYFVETSPPKTCAQAWLQLGGLNQNHPQCAPLQNKYRDDCCGSTEPPPSGFTPTYDTPGNGNSQTGDEPSCRICTNDLYPGNSDHLITARYVGTFTCGQLYTRGKNRLIPGFMCGPLQDFAYGVCDCEGGVPNNPSPVAAPTPRPNPSPVAAPTRDPTPQPTPSPVAAPTFKPNPSPVAEDTEYSLGARKVVPDMGKKEFKLSGPGRWGNRALRGGNEKQSNPMESEEPLEV
jgi:hypothetical protein